MEAIRGAQSRCEQSGTQQELFENLMQWSRSTLAGFEAMMTAQGGYGGRKPMGESRSVQGLKVLGNDKSEFKAWNEKLINVMAQCLGKPWRTFMLQLNKQLDISQKVLNTADLEVLHGLDDLDDVEQATESLYHVLVEKTEGEAALRVMSGTPGEGLQAYQKLYLWYAGTTGLALQEKLMCLMRPVQSKNEHEIADALEKWAEQERTLKMHGADYELGAACKVTALRTIMHCKREQF